MTPQNLRTISRWLRRLANESPDVHPRVACDLANWLAEQADQMDAPAAPPARDLTPTDANANTIASAPELLAALKQCRLALLALSEHHAFEDDAPEFNMGGIGYKACSVAIVAINKAEGRVG